EVTSESATHSQHHADGVLFGGAHTRALRLHHRGRCLRRGHRVEGWAVGSSPRSRGARNRAPCSAQHPSPTRTAHDSARTYRIAGHRSGGAAVTFEEITSRFTKSGPG